MTSSTIAGNGHAAAFRRPLNERLLSKLNQWQTFQIHSGHTGRRAGDGRDLLSSASDAVDGSSHGARKRLGIGCR